MLFVQDLQTMPYRQAWAIQEAAHAAAADGAPERLIVVEHPPVITLGRRPQAAGHLLASAERLADLGVQVVHSDRGGDVTFHGPGQIVVYPIIRLGDHGLSVGSYVRTLENAVVAALAELGVSGRARVDGAVGVWTDDAIRPAKLCAIGVRIRRGVAMHGLALNVQTHLGYFDLIVPCGLAGRPVTSLRKILGENAPSMARAKQALIDALQSAFAPAAAQRAQAAEAAT
jgi:lipoyl(octanoyl) transferase